MPTEKFLEKMISLFDKLSIDDSLEIYHKIGEHLHAKIEARQIELTAENNDYQAKKEKLKK